MTKLFAILSSAVEGVPLVAIAASFIWGTLSVLLSPCHLTSIPLIIGYISKQ
jgi:cytochrome c-type biogenesis protein